MQRMRNDNGIGLFKATLGHAEEQNGTYSNSKCLSNWIQYPIKILSECIN